MKLFWESVKRTVALIAAEVATLLESGSILESETWNTGNQTELAATLTVYGSMGRAYYTDGKLTKDEVNEAFKR